MYRNTASKLRRPVMGALGYFHSFIGITPAILVLVTIAGMLNPPAGSGAQADNQSTTANFISAKPRVLVLHSYHSGFTWTDNIAKGLRAAFAAFADRIDYCVEYMDTRRFHSRRYFSKLKDIYRLKYDKKKIDVVICSDDQALNFVLGTGEALFDGIPIVFCSVSGYTPSMREGRELTGLLESIDIRATMDIALKFHPQTREVAVITDMTRTGQALKAKAAEVFNNYDQRLRFTYLENLNLEGLQEKVATLTHGTIIFMFIFNRDKAGRVLSHEHNLKALNQHARIPIYAVWKFYLGHGIVGGKLTSGEAEGLMAGRMALRILSGERASEIPLQKSPTRYMFDYRQLKRYQVSESSLPPDSLIVHQPSSFYRDHRSLIWTVAIVFTLLLALVLFLVGNIARRRQVETALRESETKFFKLFDTSPIWMVLTTVAEGRYIEANQAFYEITGYSPEDVKGRTSIEIGLWVNQADRTRITKILEEDGRLISQPIKFRMKNGDIRDFLWSAAVFDFGEELCALSGIVDISDQKRLEEQLQQAQRLKSLGTLAGGIAHDFNNLLMGIQGRTSLMTIDTESFHPHYEHLREIEKYVIRAAELTKQLLGFARGGKYEVKPTDLNHLIAQNSTMFGRTKKEIAIHRIYQKDLWTVEVDRGQIDQVLLNIYVNAWQAMPQGGELFIQTENVTLDENFVSPHDVTAGPYVMTSVTDSGIGMDESTVKRVFDPFFSTKVKERGTGLGLASAYGIIKNHDGIITADSVKGQGATFKIYLPASDKAVPAVPDLKPDVPVGSETILIVDDEEMILNAGRALLEKIGYRVLTASSGRKAIRVYEAQQAEIDLVVLDIVMPDVSGSDTYDRLKKINPAIKVLLSSGYSINGQASEILDRGGHGFIQKPFTIKTFSQKVREILDA